MRPLYHCCYSKKLEKAVKTAVCGFVFVIDSLAILFDTKRLLRRSLRQITTCEYMPTTSALSVVICLHCCLSAF